MQLLQDYWISFQTTLKSLISDSANNYMYAVVIQNQHSDINDDFFKHHKKWFRELVQ